MRNLQTNGDFSGRTWYGEIERWRYSAVALVKSRKYEGGHWSNLRPALVKIDEAIPRAAA